MWNMCMLKKYHLNIGYLYHNLLNTYGDKGNIIAFQKRAQWRDITTEIVNLSIDSVFMPNQIDIYFIGGGQDQSQLWVAEDLAKNEKSELLKHEINRGIPLLAICGGFQLLGKYYQQATQTIPGVGIFPSYTVVNNLRMIGDIKLTSDFGEIYGFENHSGATYLEDNATPFGRVTYGFGNNREQQWEGCRYKNAIGTYLHGPLLPKNPQIADWLIQQAIFMKYHEQIQLTSLDSSFESAAFLTREKLWM